jgi:hypothetical protein
VDACVKLEKRRLLDAKTKTCLAEGELSFRLDEQAICVPPIMQQLAAGPA